ncbi:MAG: MarR family winged helix-turn-helix transcriptional regulator [Candidatus Thorarchaeota archaeon]
MFILDYCAKRKTCIMSDLVRDLNFTPSTATRQTDKLVNIGLVDRRQSTNDRRMTELSLTPEGRRINRLFISHRMKNIGPIIKAFDEDELGVLLKLLKSTVDRLH